MYSRRDWFVLGRCPWARGWFLCKGHFVSLVSRALNFPRGNKATQHGKEIPAMQGLPAPQQTGLRACCARGAEERPCEARGRPSTGPRHTQMPGDIGTHGQRARPARAQASHAGPHPELEQGLGSSWQLCQGYLCPSGSDPSETIMWMTQRAPRPGMPAKVEVASSHWQHGGQRIPGGTGGWPQRAPSVSPCAQSQISSLLTLDTR